MTQTNSRTTPALDRLLEHLKSTRGFDFTAYKRSTLARRVDRRIAAVGAACLDEYLDHLEVHPDELGQLLNSILINVTAFFRDPETFEHLRTHVMPAILEAKSPVEPIRIWSAGCASGEECYSVAMLLAEALGSNEFRSRVKIYATDIDEEVLTTARAATYKDGDMDGLPEDLRRKYFERNGARWVFRKELRRNVIFGRHNLLDDAPISRIDLLMCRNTLMYFNHDAQSRIVSRFHFALRDGGFLVLGRAEMLLNSGGTFSPVDLKHRIFQKLGSDADSDHMAGTDPASRDGCGTLPSTSGRLWEAAFDQDPTAQVLLDVRNHLAAANRRARELFGLHARDVGRPLQDFDLSCRPVDLRSSVGDAHARGHAVQLREVAWPSADGQERCFTVQVTPVLDGNSPLGTRIAFVDVTPTHELQQDLQRSRQELAAAYEELRSTNEDLETTNEELQATVEELETTNEELQSTNEELEKMNEELQSANEELETLNQDLRERGLELAQSNVFLGGILRSVPLGVMVLNDELHVELWNDVAADLWGLRQDEVRRKHLLTLDIGLPVEQLRQPLLALAQAGDGRAELSVQGVTRRGRSVTVRVTCAVAAGAPNAGRGIIVLMQAAGH